MCCNFFFHHHRVTKPLFSIVLHIDLLYRRTLEGRLKCRAMYGGGIASCILWQIILLVSPSTSLVVQLHIVSSMLWKTLLSVIRVLYCRASR